MGLGSAALDRLEPLLRRVGLKRRVPYVHGLVSNECGLACLAMTLGFHGRQVPLSELRALVDPSQGLTGQDLVSIGRQLGLVGRGVRIELDQLELLEPGSILLWAFNHYVVFESADAKRLTFVDPTTGRRTLPLSEVSKHFTGVVLCFEPTADLVPRSSTYEWWPFLRTVLARGRGWGHLVLTSLLLQAFGLSLPLLTGVVVDRVLPRRDERLLAMVGAGLALLIGFQFLTRIVRAHLLLYLRARLDVSLSSNLMKHLSEMSYRAFERWPLATLLETIQAPASIREVLTSSALTGAVDGTFAAFAGAILFLISPWIGLLVIGCAVFQGAVIWANRQRLTDDAAEEVWSNLQQAQLSTDLVLGMESFKGMALERRVLESWANRFAELANATLRRGVAVSALEGIVDALRFGCPLVILGLGTRAVLQGELMPGLMLSTVVLAASVLTPTAALMVSALQLPHVEQRARQIGDLLREPVEQARASHRKPAPALSGAVQVRGVHFRHSPKSPFSMEELEIDIQAGTFVALVGRSGSGKSTLAKLICGLYPPDRGQILYDGLDLAGLDLESLRMQLGIVSQHPVLGRSSVRMAIQAGEEMPFEQVVDAAKRACVHEEIVALPMGYETILENESAVISGGQRQRVCLARALARRPRILLLDEATNALDSATERNVQHELEALRCTRIVIAHRLSTVVRADLILVLEGGRIVERGTHAELLARGGAYAALVQSQLG